VITNFNDDIFIIAGSFAFKKREVPQQKKPQAAFQLAQGFISFLSGAKGRNWFGLSTVVRKRSFCAQRAALLSAFVRCELLSIVGFAVTFDSVGEFKNERHSELLFIWLQAQKSNSPTLSTLLSKKSSHVRL
jgi:hypothetical protein